MDTIKISFYKLAKACWPLFFFLIISLPSIRNFFNVGFFPTQDGDNLLIRFADFHRAILDFHFPPRWAGYLNHTFGYPVFIFLYPGLLYLWEGIKLLGFDLLTSVKISLIFSIFLSGFFMFLFLKEIFGKLPALLGGIFYVYNPYRFVNIYFRGSFGEALGLLFVPLIFWSIFKFFKEFKKVYLLLASLSLASLVTLHNVLALIFLPLIALFFIVLVIQGKKKKKGFLTFFCFLSLALSLSAFFWLPAIFERKYTVFDQVAVSQFSSYFLDPSRLFFFHKGWEQLPLQIGLFHFLAGCLSIFLLFFIKDKKLKIISLFASLTFFLSLFLMLNLSTFFWNFLKIEKFIQFPWRLLSLNSFASSFLVCLPLFLFNKTLKFPFFLIFSLAVFLNCRDYLKPVGFLFRDDNFYLTNDATTTSSNEYLPIWVKDTPRKAPEKKIEIKGQGTVEIKTYKTHKRIFTVKTEEPATVQVNTLYFPGWNLKVNGQTTKIDYIDNNGLLVFNVPKGTSEIVLNFRETPLRLISDIISFGSMVAIIFLLFKKP